MTVDLTGVAVAVASGVFSIVATVLPLWLASHMKDKAAAATLSASLDKSLGVLQQASTSAIMALRPRLPGVPDSLAPGVQYVLDHAGDEAARFGMTPVAIAQKIEARIGLKNIETNVAISGSAVPIVVKPLDPVPVATAAALNQQELARINQDIFATAAAAQLATKGGIS